MNRRILQVWQFAVVISLAATVISAEMPPAPGDAASFPSPLQKKTIVFLGDSITAGYGVGRNEAFPALIQKKIEEAALPYEVENAGLSGDTSAGGLRRLDWILQRPVDVLVLELGANDGLRGLSPGVMQSNLQLIIDKVKAQNPFIKIVVAGMQMPPNLGSEFATQFQKVFADLAAGNDAVLIPFLLAGVGGHRDLNQGDQIHPTAAGHKVIAETVWQNLRPLLGQR